MITYRRIALTHPDGGYRHYEVQDTGDELRYFVDGWRVRHPADLDVLRRLLPMAQSDGAWTQYARVPQATRGFCCDDAAHGDMERSVFLSHWRQLEQLFPRATRGFCCTVA